jgi:Ubiquitinol-cytochrome C reductase Fe-S subunit TAT signal
MIAMAARFQQIFDLEEFKAMAFASTAGTRRDFLYVATGAAAAVAAVATAIPMIDQMEPERIDPGGRRPDRF